MLAQLAGDLQHILDEARTARETLAGDIDQLVATFLTQPVTPQAAMQLETALQEVLREAGRGIVEVVYNHLEADDPDETPGRLEFDGHQYSRKNGKTNNRGGVGTLFGKIALSRFSYEPLAEARDQQRKSFSPLELSLGVVAASATPALAERVGREASCDTQQELLQRLRREHDVHWSVDVLRKVTAVVSGGVAEHLHAAQKEQLLSWLKAADGSGGGRQITLAAGRDGIMLPIRGEKTYKEGAVATITVYDRRGRRIGTVYQGQMPQAYQSTLSQQLTRLLREVLDEWDGTWPRLVYVTDAGYHPTEYYDNVLSNLAHPRRPGRRMQWTRIVDFYHACEYITKLSQVLFDEPRAGHAWSRKMRKWLKHKPNAVFRVLHSAAKYRHDYVLTKQEEEVYRSGYGYLKNHRAWMDYAEYRRRGLPIGSGVTEAGCKTVFTQRFKESGMSWGLEGGAVILTLRVARLSRIWDTAFAAYLTHRPSATLPTNNASTDNNYAKAA